MADVNDPFVCSCGNTQFIELKQFNETCCELAQEARLGNPMHIFCFRCRTIWRQTEQWSWEPMYADARPREKGWG